MKRIANIEINTDGNHAEMTFSVDATTEDEQLAIGTYVARALIDLCADIDPDRPGTAAVRFLSVAASLPLSDERVLS